MTFKCESCGKELKTKISTEVSYEEWYKSLWTQKRGPRAGEVLLYCAQCSQGGAQPASEPKQSGLQEAEGLINGPRAADYGDFSHEAKKIRSIFAELGGELTAEHAGDVDSIRRWMARQHALYMICVKLVRESNKHKRDNIVDLQGYAELYLQNCEESREEKTANKEVPGTPQQETDLWSLKEHCPRCQTGRPCAHH